MSFVTTWQVKKKKIRHQLYYFIHKKISAIFLQGKYVKEAKQEQNSLKSISYLLCYTIICQQEVADFCISFCECEKIQRGLMLNISLF